MNNISKRNFSFLLLLLLMAMLATAFGTTEVLGQEPTILRGEIWVHGNAVSGPTVNLNPAYNPSGPGVLEGIVYEMLGYEDTYSGLLKPWLAESWEWVDNFTFEIKLRPEAHWWDGSPVTADDVVFSLDSQTNPTYGGARRVEVENYTAVDQLTVHVILNADYPHNNRVLGVLIRPYVVLPKARWSILLEQYGSDIISYTDLDNLTDILASGSYRPYYVGADRTIYQRVDNYWGNDIGWFNHPQYVEDHFYGSNEATVRAGYEGHECDFSGVGFNEPDWYKANKDFMSCWDIDGTADIMFYHEPCGLPIVPNYNYSVQGVYVFRYQWLRQALAYAYDAATSLESGWAGCGNYYPPTFLNPDLVNYDLYVNETAITANFDQTEIRGGHLCIAFNETKAIEILQQFCDGSVTDGWTIKGTNVKLGYPTWTIQAVNGWADVMIEAKVMAKCWSDIGIPTEPVYPEFGTWMSNYATGNWIVTQMWSWMHLTDTANPIADTFYDCFINQPSALNIWAGSPGAYPLFFDGNHDPLPNTAGQVRDLTMSLYQMDPSSAEFVATVKELQEILVPQVPFFIPHGKSSTQAFVTDRWVNWPTVADPYEHRLDSVAPEYRLAIKHVRPRCIETTSFSLSKSVVEVGNPVTASVTLRNTADYEQKYQVEIREGTPEPGSQVSHPIVAFKVASVPAQGSVTVQLSLTFNETGNHILTVDDWRIDAADPGDPISTALVVTTPSPVVTETVTSWSTTTETTTVSVPTMDITSVAGAGIVALIVGVVVGWLVASRKK